MKNTKTPLRPRCLASAMIAALAASFGLANPAATASPIAINNPGFEDPILNDGNFQNGAPDWTKFGSPVSVGVWNPETTNFSQEAPEGQNVGYVFEAAAGEGLSQVLSGVDGQLQIDTTYTLTVKVGNSMTSAFGGYQVQLVANGTVLAEDDNTLTVASDSFETVTVTYTESASGLVGEPLEIRLLSKGLGTGDDETAFDDVQLTGTRLNPTADLGGPYTVLTNGSLELDGSGSLPSSGQSITLYEWDLNDDGTFDEGITGVTPSAISYDDLQALYGMAVGSNPIRLRVTDDSSPTPKTSITSGTITLAAPIGCQLGVLDLDANGGINPNTGNPWQVGDTYRIAFHTLGTTAAESNDPNFYNDFATAEAWQVEELQGAYWRAMVTVNLDGNVTQAESPKSHVRDNTGTDDVTGGAGVGGAGGPVYVMDGSTCIARNNADIWNSWSNPFDGNTAVRLASGSTNLNSDGNEVIASQNVHYSPFLNQFGLGDSANVHGWDIWTGNSNTGGHVNALGLTTDITTANIGASNANNTGRIWQRFTRGLTNTYRIYVTSVPLQVIDLMDTVNPTFVSIEDGQGGADATLGLAPVIYTVSFDKPINASSVELSDFGIIGSATATIDRVMGTLDSAAFEVTVTPTSTGTMQLQVNAGAVIEDAIGNPLDTSSAFTDPTTINVIQDTTPPTLVSIEDDVSGGPIVAFNPITYTVTFDKAIDASSIGIADFGNGGSAPITVNSVSPTGDPAVFIVVVTPTAAGDLIFEIVQGATIADLAGNLLDTSTALPDDTTITVEPDPLPTLVSIVDNQGGGPVFETQPFTYFATFDQAINPVTVDVTDFENGGSPAITVNAVARTSNPSVFAVHITPGGTGTITLQIASGAVIENTNGTALDTTTALADDTTLTVNAGSGPARGTITVDATAFWNAGATTITGTLNASDSDKLVVIVTGENGNPGNHTGTSSAVTYDGVPLTKVVERNPIPGPSGTTADQDQTYNDIWILDNPATSVGEIVATVSSRGNVTAFALSGTAPGVGQAAISPQASKSVILSTGFANSIVIASHGMGGDGNSANVGAVSAVSPLIQTSAQNTGGGSLWDGHVTAYALTSSPATATYEFAGGNLMGSHTIAAEFLAAEDVGGASPYDTWAAINAPTGGPGDDFDGDGLPNAIEFVLGGSKDTNDLDKLPAVATSGGDMTFTFVRDRDSVDAGVGVAIEVGTDLATWPDVYNVGADTVSSTAGVTVTDNLDGTDTITLTVAQAPDAKKFARLRVAIAP